MWHCVSEVERSWRGIGSNPDVGRFSAGLELFGDSPEKLHRGRFSEGLEHLPETCRKRRCGRFSDGLDHLSEDRRNLRRGSFADSSAARR